MSIYIYNKERESEREREKEREREIQFFVSFFFLPLAAGPPSSLFLLRSSSFLFWQLSLFCFGRTWRTTSCDKC